ncbi:MAG TPA: hypothetical protein VM051_14770 [Usitatibacter sp.]|nr:hypothetical protein [Usitatibacter sp.]
MGIKDWFAADRKKAQFREKAKEALSGKLAPGKAQKLAEVARQHEIENPADDKTQLRREIFNQAAGAVKARSARASFRWCRPTVRRCAACSSCRERRHTTPCKFPRSTVQRRAACWACKRSGARPT